MPRQPRQFASGETFHLTSRGIDKRDIFLDDRDRRRFVHRLGIALDERPVSCLSYCLMGNHVHLLLHGEGAGLSSVMRDVLGGHARFFNKKYGRAGHLFGERFHAVHIESTAQLHAAIRYVELNPVRAGFVGHPREWPWGSYSALSAGTVQPGTLDIPLLGRMLDAGSARPGHVAAALARTVEIGLADARLAARAATQ